MAIFIALLAVALGVLLPAPASATKVLAVAWDGAAFGVVRPLYQTGRLPNLKALGALGQTTSIANCYGERCMQVMSKPQYAAILTGRHADETGVWANQQFQLIPDGMTVYEALRGARGDTVRIGHIGGNRNTSATLFGNAVPECDVFTAYYGVEYQPANIDRAISLIEMWRDDDWFIFLHLSSTDYAGHRSGAHSEGYRQAIVDLDTVLGRLMTAIGDAADAHVFIFGDHGMGAFDYPTGLAKPTKHDLSTPNALFVYSGDKERPRNVYTDQLVPTWLSLFGIAE